MRLGVFVVDVMMVFSLCGLSPSMMSRFTRMLVDDARKCDGDEREQNLCDEIASD